jgi:hypothetical protein
MNQSNDADDFIGKAHPLFMASAQEGVDALIAVDTDIPLEKALPSISEWLTDLFGDLPLGLVEERVRSICKGRSA